MGQSGPESNGNEGVLRILQAPALLFSAISRTLVGTSGGVTVSKLD